MKVVGAHVLAAALLVTGCSGDSQPTTPPATTTSSPVTETFTSIVALRGTDTHSFATPAAGTISVTLTLAGPPLTVVMGLGLGVPNPFGPGCSLTTSVKTTSGSSPQITSAADPGKYCVAISDLGNAPPTGISFAMTIVHP